MVATQAAPAETLQAIRAAITPISEIERLRWAVDDLETLIDHTPERFQTGTEARDAMQLAEKARRLAAVVTVRCLDTAARSGVTDHDGHASAKTMFAHLNGLASRDVYGLEQIRNLLNRCRRIRYYAYRGKLSFEHLRLLARVYANRRTRKHFINQQTWLLHKAMAFDYLDSLTNGVRRVIIDAANVVIDMSQRRFFTGLARTALQLIHHECEWPGCHVPVSRCQGDHTTPKPAADPPSNTTAPTSAEDTTSTKNAATPSHATTPANSRSTTLTATNSNDVSFSGLDGRNLVDPRGNNTDVI